MHTLSSLQNSVCTIVFIAMAMLSTQSSPAQEAQPAAPQATPSPRAEARHKIVSPGPPTVQEKLIAEIAVGSEYVAGNALGHHILWSQKTGDQHTVWLDGKQIGGTYQQVRRMGLRGKDEDPHVIMAAKRRSKWVGIYDGEERTAEYDKMTAVDVGPSGHPLIAGGCRAKKCYLIMDGKETGPEFEDIGAPDFNLKSGHYVYFGKRSKKWVAMLDGKEIGPEMDDYDNISWGPEGKLLAVAARMGNKYTWIVDGSPGPLFDVIGEIAFSRDGQHYAFGGARVRSSFGSQEVRGSMVVDGKESEETWKGEGLTGGWTALLGSYRYVLKGIKSLSADFHGVSDPVFAGDGGPVFAKRLGDGLVVVHFGGRAGPALDDVMSSIMISDDGKHVAYVGRQGDSFLDVRDQTLGVSFPGKRQVSFVGWIAINKDGTRVAYEIVRGGTEYKAGTTRRALRRVVINGQGGREYDSHNLVISRFSDDGNHYAYAVHGAQGDRDRMVFDDVEGPIYDDIFNWSTHFLDERSIEFVARQGRRLVRVTMKLG